MPSGWPPALQKTIALVRDDTEREIAAHRVRLYAFALVITVAVLVIGTHRLLWVPPTMLSLGVGVGLGIRHYVRRRGFSPLLVILSSLFDFLLTGALFVAAHYSTPNPAPLITASFLSVEAVAFMFLLTISSLRLSVGVAVGTTIFASAVYLACTLLVLPPAPGFFLAAGLMLFMIWFSSRIIQRTRRNLEISARYQELRRYLPAAAVERVLHDDLDTALSVGGQSLEVTLLASDLRGFTTLSETLEPEEVVRQLNAYHAVMLEQIDRFGGSLDKFMGDGTLVVFGLPTGGETVRDAGAGAAVVCAGAMIEALATLNTDRAKTGLPRLRMGIGVHTGRVVAGNIGAPGRRLEFTVIGDAVNTAARLESATKELGHPVVVSKSTAERLASTDALSALPPVQLRGKQAPLEVFTLKDAAAAPPGERSAGA